MKKQQVKMIDLGVETSVPGLTPAELQEAMDKEVCSVESKFFTVFVHWVIGHVC